MCLESCLESLKDAMENCRRGCTGTLVEAVVFFSLLLGLASTAALLNICNVLLLDDGAGAFGPWMADVPGLTDGCKSWDPAASDDADWMMRTGQWCSALALGAGALLVLVCAWRQCLCGLPGGHIATDVLGGIVLLALSLVWAMTGSGVCYKHGGCSLGEGAVALVSAQGGFLVAVACRRCMRDPRHERRKREKERVTEADVEEPLIGGKAGGGGGG